MPTIRIPPTLRADFVNVYVGGEDVRTRDGLDTEVRESDQLILLPAMAGGC